MPGDTSQLPCTVSEPKAGQRRSLGMFNWSAHALQSFQIHGSGIEGPSLEVQTTSPETSSFGSRAWSGSRILLLLQPKTTVMVVSCCGVCLRKRSWRVLVAIVASLTRAILAHGPPAVAGCNRINIRIRCVTHLPVPSPPPASFHHAVSTCVDVRELTAQL